MKLLLDSNIILWLIYTPEKVPHKIRAQLVDASSQRLISDASIWEITLKLTKGRLVYTDDLASFLHHLTDLKAAALPITREHMLASVQLPNVHADPFDRIMVAQATAEQAVLLTSDAILNRYSTTNVLWIGE